MHDIPPHSPEPQPHEGGIRFHPQSTGTDLMRGDQVPLAAHKAQPS